MSDVTNQRFSQNLYYKITVSDTRFINLIKLFISNRMMHKHKAIYFFNLATKVQKPFRGTLNFYTFIKF